jgi:hypothetical protein
VADEWQGFSLTLDPNQIVGRLINSIDAVLQYGITLLELADLILSVMQSLLFGLIDPIRAIIEALLDELRALIEDLIQTGIYVAGDFKLLTPNNLFADVVGGYPAYEQRMIARFVDRTDPNRPDFSPNAPTVGVFFYVSSGDIGKVIKAISSLLALFGPFGNGTTSFPPPSVPKAEIGVVSDLLAPRDRDDVLTVTWSFSQVAGVVSGLLAPAPAGFVIEISTIPTGLQAVGLSADDQNSSSTNPAKNSYLCFDAQSGKALNLYGGIGVCGSGSTGKDWSALESGTQELRFRLDQVTPLIKPTDLVDGDNLLLGAAFYVKAGVFPKLVPGQRFTTKFKRDMLPKHASFENGRSVVDDTRTYYIRVRAVASELATVIEDDLGIGALNVGDPFPLYGGKSRLFFFSTDGVRNAGGSKKLYPDASTGLSTSELRCNQYSLSSSPVSVTFPSAAVKAYRSTVQQAVAVAILARMDLKSSSTYAVNRVAAGNETNLEGFIAQMLLRYKWYNLASPSVQEKFRDVTSFRSEVLSVSASIAANLMQRNPPSDELAALVTDQASPILDYRFKGKSLLELLESEDSSFGLGANPMSLEAGFLEEYTGPFRTPGFLMKQGVDEGDDVYFWVPDVGSCDNSPVLYDESLPNKVVFFRNVAISDDLLIPAANVIRFAAGILSRAPNDSNWTAIRIFEQNLTPITDILTVIDNYLSSFLGSVQTLIDSIIAAIQAIRARLNQLQALLETIRALLRSLSAFTISPMSALVTVGNGTDGVLANLVNSQNKPSDGPDSYGAGMVLVSGGPNRFFFELLGLT